MKSQSEIRLIATTEVPDVTVADDDASAASLVVSETSVAVGEDGRTARPGTSGAEPHPGHFPFPETVASSSRAWG